MGYLAIVREVGGVVEKYQPFDTQEQAEAHVSQYGGFVVQEPVGAYSLKYCTVDSSAKSITYNSILYDSDNNITNIKKTIRQLEGQVTQRRIREAIAGTDGGWLANQESLIATERAKL